ncbi:hypothetical protein FQZ97_957020 [compost metagenome]
MAVLQHLAGDETQATALRFFKRRVHRSRMRGGKGQRGGHAMATQFIEEEAGHLPRMIGVLEPRLVRKGVVLQPGQQTRCRRTDHIRLRIVDVHVHKTRRNDLAAQVFHGHTGEAVDQRGVVTHGTHDRLTLGVRPHDQQAIGLEHGRLVVGKTQEGRSVGFHGNELSAMKSARHTERDMKVIDPSWPARPRPATSCPESRGR